MTIWRRRRRNFRDAWNEAAFATCVRCDRRGRDGGRKRASVGAGLAGASSGPGKQSLASLHLAAFEGCQGQRFVVRHDLGRTVLELTSASHSGPRPPQRRAGQECFAVGFRRIQGPSLSQDTYQVMSKILGKFPLFVVPNGPRGRSYTAVINRVTTD